MRDNEKFYPVTKLFQMEHRAQEIKDNPNIEDVITDVVANNSDTFEHFVRKLA